jgi:serine/threonine/tyrosine protein kinase RAD53
MLNGVKRDEDAEADAAAAAVALAGPAVQLLDVNGAPDSQQDTQPATQPADEDGAPPTESQQLKDRCWGWLQPLSRDRAPAHFERPHNKYKIGRGVKCNIRLTGNKVSECAPLLLRAPTRPDASPGSDHCDIEWDGVEDPSTAITLTDNSSNGTFVSRSAARRVHGLTLRPPR